MKNVVINFLFIALITGSVLAQPGVPPVGDLYSLLSGEHTPVIYSGSGEVSSSAACSTQWLQIGYSPETSNIENSAIGRFDPRRFTIGVRLSLTAGADSALITSARFELAYDTTSSVYWISDSSNVFISTNSYSRQDYGIWTFYPQSGTSQGKLYPLRVLQGGFIRFIFETTTSDAVEIDWILTGEH